MSKTGILVLIGAGMNAQQWTEARVSAEQILFGQELITSGKLQEIADPMKKRIGELEKRIAELEGMIDSAIPKS
jgi:hypothetical protein